MITRSIKLVSLLVSTIALVCLASSAQAIHTKRIALTIDDAPRGMGPHYSGEQRTDALIDSLRSVKAGPVAFFITTQNIDKNGNRERIESYASAGHLIANHSHQHPWLSRVDADEYIAGIDAAEKLLQGFDNRRPWFRFPYLDEGSTLAKRDQLRRALKQRDLTNGYVTVDNYDWYIESKWKEAVEELRTVDLNALRDVYLKVMLSAVNFFDELAIKQLAESPAHVLLLHENDLAALFIDDLISELRAQGWEIISPDQAYQDPIALTMPETLMANQGLVAALAIEAGTQSEALSHLAIEEDLIDSLLEDYKVFGTKGSVNAEFDLSNPH